MLRFDLGGVGKCHEGHPFQTVNLFEGSNSDIQADITDLDAFCQNNSVDEFLLTHTLEHIYPPKYKQFLLDIHKKLAIGGVVTIIQTDAEHTINQWVNGTLNWRGMRGTLFPPQTV
jgi:predicted SAM-dependent methyltransferase